jgi:hypothetical protein
MPFLKNCNVSCPNFGKLNIIEDAMIRRKA